MSPEFRNLRARDLVSALERDGFVRTRQTGSHATFRKGERKVMVAIHSGGSTIPVGTVSRIIKDAGWSDNDLKRLKLMK